MLSLVSRAKANSPFPARARCGAGDECRFRLGVRADGVGRGAAAADAIGAGGAAAELRAAGQEGDCRRWSTSRVTEKAGTTATTATRPRIRSPGPDARRTAAGLPAIAVRRVPAPLLRAAGPAFGSRASNSATARNNSASRSASRWARASSSIRRGYVVTNNHVVGECRQGDGDLPGRQQASRQDHRPRHQDRSRAAQDRAPTSRCPM